MTTPTPTQDIAGIPIELDPTMPPDMFEIRPQTIRQHLDAIINDATHWTEKEAAHAIAALAILDHAPREAGGVTRAVISDPDHPSL